MKIKTGLKAGYTIAQVYALQCCTGELDRDYCRQSLGLVYDCTETDFCEFAPGYPFTNGYSTSCDF